MMALRAGFLCGQLRSSLCQRFCTKATLSFQSLGLSEKIVKHLERANFTVPTEIQTQVCISHTHHRNLF
jgi:superfamily II DNA/RNA helicase